VRAQPDDQQDLIVKVDGYNQAVVIAFNVEHYSLARNDARRAKLGL
jgi:hypothetical protein